MRQKGLLATLEAANMAVHLVFGQLDTMVAQRSANGLPVAHLATAYVQGPVAAYRRGAQQRQGNNTSEFATQLVDNVIHMAFGPVPKAWRPLFGNCFALLADMHDINWEQRSGS